jgi:hypothetical protein
MDCLIFVPLAAFRPIVEAARSKAIQIECDEMPYKAPVPNGGYRFVDAVVRGLIPDSSRPTLYRRPSDRFMDGDRDWQEERSHFLTFIGIQMETIKDSYWACLNSCDHPRKSSCCFSHAEFSAAF